ncbi:fluoride efflux transporter CrcB [Paenibacillaceae bacterium WGS1546]|uniref:fluoride efflux transporter CrcB n=1 Tax=Cohnella sp. WGS1546 TaxID=3366810 RepID=UPI00372D550C
MKAALSTGAFGMAGAVMRFSVGHWTHGWWSAPFPLGTLLVNLSGCLALGWFASWAESRHALPSWLRVGVGTGLIGAYTTFSTFSMETVSLLQQRLAGLALLYVIASLFGGLAFAWLGRRIWLTQNRQSASGGRS